MDYADLRATIAALTEGEEDPVALMATLACEIHHADARFNWTGFYRVVAPELLKIGPYQGGHGCLAIPAFDGSEALIAVLDIDSDQPDAFDQADADALQAILNVTFATA